MGTSLFFVREPLFLQPFLHLEVQGVLVTEVGILPCHQKLEKSPTRGALAWAQYEKRVLVVSVPPERVRQNSLVSSKKAKDWTGAIKSAAGQCQDP